METIYLHKFKDQTMPIGPRLTQVPLPIKNNCGFKFALLALSILIGFKIHLSQLEYLPKEEIII